MIVILDYSYTITREAREGSREPEKASRHDYLGSSTPGFLRVLNFRISHPLVLCVSRFPLERPEHSGMFAHRWTIRSLDSPRGSSDRWVFANLRISEFPNFRGQVNIWIILGIIWKFARKTSNADILYVISQYRYIIPCSIKRITSCLIKFQ